jgi:hypothetical protein
MSATHSRSVQWHVRSCCLSTLLLIIDASGRVQPYALRDVKPSGPGKLDYCRRLLIIERDETAHRKIPILLVVNHEFNYNLNVDVKNI